MGSPKLSTLSLNEALVVIDPHLEHLSFQDRDAVLHRIEFKDQIKEGTYYFHIWPRFVMVPDLLPERAKIHVIPLQRDDIVNSRGRLIKVVYRNLILEKYKTDKCYGRWLFQSSTFIPASHSIVGPKQKTARFDMDSGTVEYVDDRYLDGAEFYPEDFPKKFWKYIADWVKDSLEVRKRAITSLGELSNKALQFVYNGDAGRSIVLKPKDESLNDLLKVMGDKVQKEPTYTRREDPLERL